MLAWELNDQPYDRGRADIVVTAEQFHEALAGEAVTKPGRRRMRRRPRPQVALKMPAGENLLGRTILITRDRTNSTVTGATGPWHVAASAEGDVVVARIRQVVTMERGNDLLVRLDTEVGEIGWIPMGCPVIPIEQV